MSGRAEPETSRSKAKIKTSCCLTSCRSTSLTGVSFFRLPVNDPKRLSVFLDFIGDDTISGKPAGKLRSIRICELHFSPRDIIPGAHKKNLTENAVPSVRSPARTHPAGGPSENSLHVQQNELITPKKCYTVESSSPNIPLNPGHGASANNEMDFGDISMIPETMELSENPGIQTPVPGSNPLRNSNCNSGPPPPKKRKNLFSDLNFSKHEVTPRKSKPLLAKLRVATRELQRTKLKNKQYREIIAKLKKKIFDVKK